MKKIICVIPARYNSVRFPGKVLADICGKPMLQHVWEKAKQVKIIDKVIIATDDKRIYNKSKEFCAEVVLTSKNCKSGTDRVAETVDKIQCDIVVNLQADEPLISPRTIEKTIDALLNDKIAVVSTPVQKCTNDSTLTDLNTVKVTFDKNNYALYFSRLPIPYQYLQPGINSQQIFYKHIGLYVYRREFLKQFVKLPVSCLEKMERLEQLRILENGYKIKVVPVSEKTIAVDRPEDIDLVAQVIKKSNCEERRKNEKQ